MTCEAYEDLVAAHVDGVLASTELREVEQHLTACVPCQQLFANQARFRAAWSARHLIVPVPSELEERLYTALHAQRIATPAWRERFLNFFARPRLALSLAIAGVLFALLFPRLFSSTSELPWFIQARNSYEAATTGQLSLSYRITEPRQLEAALNGSRRLNFTTHVLDLRAAGYQLEGGTIVEIQGRPVAVVLYRGVDGPLVCLRQRGTTPPMPTAGEGHTGKFLYHQAGYTLSVMQDSEHFCTLIARLPRAVFQQRLGIEPAA
jgi:anti-sigma factor RsiW